MKTNNTFLKVLIPLFLLLTLFISSMAGASPEYQNETTYQIGPGVKYTLFEHRFGEQIQTIHVVRIDRKNPYIRIQSYLATGSVLGSQKVSDQANTLDGVEGEVIAGINGDFFYTDGSTLGSPFGLHIQNGVISISPNHFPTLGIQPDGTLHIGRADLDMVAEVICDSHIISEGTNIAGLNRPMESEMTLYTPDFSSHTPKRLNETIEVIIQPVQWNSREIIGNISYIHKGYGGSFIPSNGIILSGRADHYFFHELTPGDTVRITIAISPPFNQTTFAISGPNHLVHNGTSLVLDSLDPFVVGNHPRTAVGFNNEELFLIVVDGRDSYFATGINLLDLAEFMIELGIKEGINLDGGGSSTLVINDPSSGELVVINSPSDGKERSVGNSLMVLSTAKTDEVKYLDIFPKNHAILMGSTLQLFPVGKDEFNNVVLLPTPNQIEWSVTNDIASIEDGHFIPKKPGLAVIEARTGNAYGSLEVLILDHLDELDIIPDVLSLKSGETFTPNIVASEGKLKVLVDPSSLKWSYPIDLLYVNPWGSIEALTSGEGVVTASYGEATDSIKISVDQPAITLWDFRSLGNWYTTAIRGKSDLDIYTLGNETNVRLNYQLKTNETGTAAVYLESNPNLEIPGAPRRLGLWVYGDGGGHWLRAQYYDGNGALQTINFTSTKGITFLGWRYLEAELDTKIPTPYRLWRIYLVQTDENKKGSGSILFGDLMAIY